MPPEPILDTIGLIYDAGLDSERWQDAVASLAGVLRSSYAFAAFRASSGRFPNHHAVQNAQHVSKQYFEYYQQVDPVIALLRRATPGFVVTDEMVGSKAELHRSELYNDFARPNGIDTVMQAVPMVTASGSGFVAAARSRSEGDFEEEDRRTLGLLLPHFARAMQLQLRLLATSMRAESLTAALDRIASGVVLVDRAARVLYANKEAEAALSEADGIRANAAGLHAATSSQTAGLRRLIAQAADHQRIGTRGGALRLDRLSMRPPLLVNVLPVGPKAREAGLGEVRPVAIVFISDPDRQSRRRGATLQALYKLTPAEATVAEAIARGHGIADAARDLGIAASTLRWHLKHVFEKTETTRQAELVRLVERLAVVDDTAGPR